MWILSKQVIVSKKVLKYEAKLLSFIQSRTWPRSMEAVRNNLLFSIVLYAEITANLENGFAILDKLPSALQRVTTDLLHQPDEALKPNIETQKLQVDENQAIPPANLSYCAAPTRKQTDPSSIPESIPAPTFP